MSQKNKKACFVELGKFLSQFSSDGNVKNDRVLHNDAFFDDFVSLIGLSQSHNGWFTPEQVYFAVQSWAAALTEENLNRWLSAYQTEVAKPRTVAIIMAGNIPLVGFHDFLSVLVTGHKALIKRSSNDQQLIQFLAKYLMAVCPEMERAIEFNDGMLANFDAVIATGSNNTARYFEYYFREKPSIIRKNRNSVAVLSGNESHQDLVRLGEDIFRYFGLGCRNVSKLFVPQGYDFTDFFKAIFEQRDVIQYEKYANNYDYNKAVFLMSNFKLLDNEFLTLKEDTSYASPISSVFYEYYDDLRAVQATLEKDKDLIQCVVSKNLVEGSVGFGQTQKPNLWDYADNVDTVSFLLSI